MKTQVVSFSGGRTSAYLVHLMEQRRATGEDVRYIFTDTGAEHPKTYEFIRNLVAQWGIDLICLRLVINPKLGIGNTYKVVSVDEIGQDLEPFRAALSKYGTPYTGGRFCTRTMKIEPFDRYCKDNFPQFEKWLGIRIDEPKRLKPKNGVHYLADISDFDKPDVLAWWKKQPFDLDLPEHLGNCVFCIEKGINKIALAARDEPQMAADFWQLVNDPGVRVVERRQQENKIMYRGNNSLESIIALFSEHSREDIAATIRGGGGYESGSCTESCELDVDLTDADIEAEVEEEAPIKPRRRSHLKPEYASNTPVEHRDTWQAPVEVFDALDLEFGFWLDAAADDSNALCARYLTEADNALMCDWESKGAIFCNPPYSDITPWVLKAAEQCQKQHQPVVMLLPADTSTGWFATALQTVDEVRLVTEGRIQFINSGTGKPGKNGAGKGNIFLIWRPFTTPRRQFTTVTRAALLSMGSQVRAA